MVPSHILDQLPFECSEGLALAQAVAKNSHEDPLAGLSNRRYFEVQVQASLADLRRGCSAFAVLYSDLDRFKSVDDSLGHDAGDGLLISVARMLRRLCDPEDVIAHIGGEEYIILKIRRIRLEYQWLGGRHLARHGGAF